MCLKDARQSIMSQNSTIAGKVLSRLANNLKEKKSDSILVSLTWLWRFDMIMKIFHLFHTVFELNVNKITII